MAHSYLFPSDGSSARSVALTPFALGFLVAKWDAPIVWYWSGTSYVSSAISTTANYGFSSSASDGIGGAWLSQYSGQLVHYPASGSPTLYTLPNDIITGTAFVPSFNLPYVIGATGQVYTISGTGTVPVGLPFGNSTSWGLAASGTTLFTMLANTGQLGSFSLSSAATGVASVTAIPLSVPTCITATPGSVAIGGWTNAAIPQGFTHVSTSPIASYITGITFGSNIISIYNSTTYDIWTLTQILTGLGAPAYSSWSTDGTYLAISDPVCGQVSIYNFLFGNFIFVQNVTLSNAGEISFISPRNLLLCQTNIGHVASLYASGATWVAGNSVIASGVTSIAQSALYQAIVGYTSGVAFLAVSPNTELLSILTQVALPFTPLAVAADLLGNNCAVGNFGASGFLSIFSGQTLVTTLGWVGSGTAVDVFRNQYVVVDPSVPCLRVFGFANNSYQQISIITSVPPGLDGADLIVTPTTQFSLGGTTLVLGASSVWEYQFVSPFGMVNVPNGAVSIYRSGFFTTTPLGINQTPSALVYDTSGNIRISTVQNSIFTVSSGGLLINSEAITVYPQQVQVAPLGVSSMALSGANVYGSSSLSGFLVAFDQSLGSPWIHQ